MHRRPVVLVEKRNRIGTSVLPGKGGAGEVTNYAANMILTDDSLATLAHAIEIGHGMWAKIEDEIRNA